MSLCLLSDWSSPTPPLLFYLFICKLAVMCWVVNSWLLLERCVLGKLNEKSGKLHNTVKQ